MHLSSPELISIDTIAEPLGNLSFLESNRSVPFEIQRVYFITSNPPHARRGGHAHKEIKELVIAVRGAFTIELENQQGDTFSFRLDSPQQGLLVPPLCWRILKDYLEDSACLVLASGVYDENEYLRDHDAFLKYRPPAD